MNIIKAVIITLLISFVFFEIATGLYSLVEMFTNG